MIERLFSMVILSTIAMISQSANSFSLGGRLLAIKEGYNEKQMNDQFLAQLDKIEGHLKRFEDNFQTIRKDTLGQIDQLTGFMSSKKSIDTLKDYLSKAMMKKKFEEQVRNVVKANGQVLEDNEKVLNALQKSLT